MKDVPQGFSERETQAAALPWMGCPNEEELRKQILALSSDKRVFLAPPPPDTSFTFDYQVQFPDCIAILKVDPQLQRMRFNLVPERIKEEPFWRNYFYRVGLIKQSKLLGLQGLGAADNPPDDITPPLALALENDASRAPAVPAQTQASSHEDKLAATPIAGDASKTVVPGAIAHTQEVAEPATTSPDLPDPLEFDFQMADAEVDDDVNWEEELQKQLDKA
ncbi:uncharacterized protein BJ171DRAFT_485448 [Polychytrium aggregatum]|uniref:uncharacterized protein n=1 Tax=Polychytrium aggregatum TaxID=110093 RepID=UPI0022FF0AB1|nr:uncharacterized protein BJ171DRAFT_485448 [Polychytrium aggregatum]KAI9209882.1 hypothetical protein BJ171DRAFT_485448 [Polychytrium aggregatum]